jgi:hypothetical protein
MQRIGFVTLVILGGLVSGAIAGPLAPTKPSQVVTLANSGLACPLLGGGQVFDVRVGSDGSETPFSIPDGQVLVITGIDWSVFLLPGLPGETVIAFLRTPPSPSAAPTVWRGAAVADANGRAGGTAVIPNVVVKPGVPVCLFPGGSAGTLHGFLAKDE